MENPHDSEMNNEDEAEEMVSEDSSDSEMEREEHYKLERRAVELRKEVKETFKDLTLINTF